MAKVLFVSNDPAIFSEQSAVRARMRAYAEEIGELHVVSAAPKKAEALREGPLFLHPLRAPKLLRVRALTRAAHRLILQYRIEVVSAQDPFEHGLAAFRAVRGTGARLHLQVHTDFLSPWFVFVEDWHVRTLFRALMNRYRMRLADRLLPAASGIRAVSVRIQTSLMARYGSRIAEPNVIPIAVDRVVPPPVALPLHRFDFTLLYVGRLEAEKRVQDLLLALRQCVGRHPSLGLFIVGSGRERERLAAATTALSLEPYVRFLGARSDARALMGSADAYIQASAYEGYGLTLVEAALAKLPIITTHVGVVGEVFTPGSDVLTVSVARPDLLAAHIDRIIASASTRAALTEHAETAARAHLAREGSLPLRIARDLAHDSTQLFRGSRPRAL